MSKGCLFSWIYTVFVENITSWCTQQQEESSLSGSGYWRTWQVIKMNKCSAEKWMIIFDKIRVNIWWVVDLRPSKPTRLQVTDVNGESMTLKWDPPENHAVVNSYTIKFREATSNEAYQQVVYKSLHSQNSAHTNLFHRSFKHLSCFPSSMKWVQNELITFIEFHLKMHVELIC